MQRRRSVSRQVSSADLMGGSSAPATAFGSPAVAVQDDLEFNAVQAFARRRERHQSKECWQLAMLVGACVVAAVLVVLVILLFAGHFG